MVFGDFLKNFNIYGGGDGIFGDYSFNSNIYGGGGNRLAPNAHRWVFSNFCQKFPYVDLFCF